MPVCTANSEHPQMSEDESGRRRDRAVLGHASVFLDRQPLPAPTTSWWSKLSLHPQCCQSSSEFEVTDDSQITHYKVPRSQTISSRESPLRLQFFISDALTLGLSDPLAWDSNKSETFVARTRHIGLQYHDKRHSEAC